MTLRKFHILSEQLLALGFAGVAANELFFSASSIFSSWILRPIIVTSTVYAISCIPFYKHPEKWRVYQETSRSWRIVKAIMAIIGFAILVFMLAADKPTAVFSWYITISLSVHTIFDYLLARKGATQNG